MERLEKRRLGLMEDKPDNMGMIIPIIFRGDLTNLPSRIKDRVHYCDFSKFTLATTEIKQNTDYYTEIEKIADIIYKFDKLFKEQGIEPCECNSFSLPSEEELKLEPWREKMISPFPLFPGREV